MRDHLFHAEKDEMLFRQFREESQISFSIPPESNRKASIKFTFPKPYSICIQVYFLQIINNIGGEEWFSLTFWTYGEIEFSSGEMVLS